MVSDRLGMEGLETMEGSGSDSSDDDSDEAPGTSGMSSPVPSSDSAGVERAGGVPRSPQGAGAQSTDCSSPEELPSPGAGPGNGISDDLCAPLGDTSAQERVERKVAAETETAPEEKEAESRGPREAAAAGPGLNQEKETEEVTDGERAARAAPGEDGGSIPSTKPGDSQAGSTVSNWGRV